MDKMRAAGAAILQSTGVAPVRDTFGAE
jgi:hypothetical protein